MKVLDMERHGHKVIAAEGPQWKGVFSEGLHVLADRFGEDTESTEARKESKKRNDKGAGRGTGMGEDDYPFLIEDSFPDFIELLNPKKIDDDLEVATDVELAHLQLRPALTHILVEILVGCVDQLVVVEV